MRRMVLVLAVAALVAVMLAVSAAPALANHFLNGPPSGGPGEGNSPARIFVGGHDETQGSTTSCEEIVEHGADDLSPLEEHPFGCRIFLPDP